MKKSVALVSLVAPFVLMSCGTASGLESGAEMVQVWSVDTTGKPPFKRTLVEVPAADIARMEIEDAAVETVSMRLTDFRGKPPFRRTIQEVPVIDAASLEAVQESSRKAGPRRFGKRHP